MVHYWLYRSRAASPVMSADDVLIYLQSLNRNVVEQVTGILFRSPTHYVQYIEGPRESVEALSRDIASDLRHMAIETLARGETEARLFRTWDMTLDPREQNAFAEHQRASRRRETIGAAGAEDLLVFIAKLAAGMR